MMIPRSLTYCGPAVAPPDIVGRWNFDPYFISAMLAVILAFGLYSWRNKLPLSRNICFAFGVGALALIFVSPLCALSVSLFSARAAHHMALTLVAAPLLVLGAGKRQKPLAGAIISAACFACLSLFWMAPFAYAATFSNAQIYWLMNLGILASALTLWNSVLSGRAGPLATLAASLVIALQMSLLGAILSMTETPLYSPHFFTTSAWNLSPLDDQRLGGLIIWVVGSIPFLAIALSSLHGLIFGSPFFEKRAAHG